MNKCSICGAEAKENARFCKACGAPAGDEALKDKKTRVMRKEKTWVKPAIIAGAVLLVLAGAWTAKGVIMAKKMGGRPMFAPHRDQSARLTNALPVKEQGGIVSIALAAVDDGKAHFFSYSTNGKMITFFVMKAADGSIRSAFDACMSCNHAKLGYRQEEGLVVCNNCGMGFNPGEIGKVTGGCSPIPIEKSTEGQMIVLRTRDLEAGAQYF